MLSNLSLWKRVVLAIVVITLGATPASAQTPVKIPALTPAQMREDLTFLQTQWAPLDKSFTLEQRRAFDDVIKNAMAAAGTFSTADFALEVMRAAAISRNGHTAAKAGFLLHDLPIRAWWFADGLYIVKADPEFADLVGARIDKLGSLTPDEALARVSPFISGSDHRIRFLSANYLISSDVLQHIGATSDASKVELQLRLRDGSTRTANLAPAATLDPSDAGKKGNRGYTVLIPDEVGLAGRWPHILDGVKQPPVIYTKRTDVSTSWIGDNNKVLYIRCDSVSSIDETPLLDKIANIVRKSILPSRPKFVVFDLRFNNGGDFFNTILFAQALPRLLPPDGHVFVLTGRATFSAGIVTAALLKGADPKKVTLIGETMGDKGQFWAEGESSELPNSKIQVAYSEQYEDFENGCTDIDTCYWPVVAFGPRNISLAPEIKMDVSFADYASGRDPVLEKALALTK